jgi:hypothetical protein
MVRLPGIVPATTLWLRNRRNRTPVLRTAGVRFFYLSLCTLAARTT